MRPSPEGELSPFSATDGRHRRARFMFEIGTCDLRVRETGVAETDEPPAQLPAATTSSEAVVVLRRRSRLPGEFRANTAQCH